MKRGLVVLDPAEVTVDEFRGRVARLQQELKARNLAAALMYGDVYRSGDLSYLTNVCIYWNEGMLVVPAEGEPVFITKLSARVQPWMKASSILTDIRSGPDLAAQLANYLADQGEPGTIGVVEQNWWPGMLLEAVAAAVAPWSLQDVGPLVKELRQNPSPAELQLLRRGAEVGAAAVLDAAGAGLSRQERAGLAERSARAAGVEDVYVWCDEGPAGSAALELLPEWRGYWTWAARTITASPLPGWADAFTAGYEAAVNALRGGVRPADAEAAARPHLEALDSGARWQLDLITHPDLESRGDYRNAGEEEAPIQAGNVAGLRLSLELPGGERLVAADTFLLTAEGHERLTEKLPASPFLER